MTKLLVYFCKALSWLSLPTVQRLGGMLGACAYWLDKKSNRIAFNHITQSGLTQTPQATRQLVWQSRIASGQSLLESLFIWGSQASQLLPLVKSVHGWQHVLDAQATARGIIFLTPHLGCYEMAAIYYGAQQPISVLYRPPKLKWLQSIVTLGRSKGQVRLAPANAHGVKQLLLALKAGQAVGILPDQIPREGEGEWAPLFGKPAYTMGLASKLAVKTNATVLMAFAERLPAGQGYAIYIRPVASIATPTLLNQAIEQQIAQCPQQYLWQYNRYKQRRYALHKLKPTDTGP